MTKFSAVWLFACVVATISVMWVPQKWATTVPEVGCCLLASVWALFFLLGRTKPRLSMVLPPLVAIIAWGCLQLVSGSTVYRWPTRLAVLYWCGNAAAFFCGLQIFADTRIRALFLRALIGFGFVAAIFCTIHALTSLDMFFWRYPIGPHPIGPLFGPFRYRNQFAALMEILFPVALYSAITTRRLRFVYFLIAATLYASVIAAASRAGFILSTIELAVVPILVVRGRNFSRAQLINGVLVLIGMLLWLAIPAGPDQLISRLGQSDPFLGRREFNESSVEMIKERPLLGFGLGNWPTAYPGYAKFDDGNFANAAHNDWAQWTVEGGIPLLALMLFIAGWATVRGIKTGWGLGVPIIFLHCFVDYPIQRPGVSIVFFLMMAAIAHGGTSRREGAEP
jgi:O-antigen ligase